MVNFMKKILDVCCSGREFWFNRKNDSVIYCDNRKGKYPYSDGRIIDVDPDVICDFTNLPFESNLFSLVVFDPPHLKSISKTSNMSKKYGSLQDDWREVLSGGFKECFRVLKQDGILVFKWNEYEIPLKEVLSLSPVEALFGHRSGKHAKTHWICFMKTEQCHTQGNL